MPTVPELAFLLGLLLSPRDRAYAMRWWRGRKSDFPLGAAFPWIVFPAIDYLEKFDFRGARVFEYGSGGSTCYWLRKGATHVVSVEHDPQWFATTQRNAASPAVELRLIEPEPDPAAVEDDPADPAAFVSDDARFRAHRFTRYVQQIDGFPDSFFDVVLVDGRARPSCIVHAAPKVKPGGMLVVDNADRDYYFTHTQPSLAGFSPQWFRGPGPVNAVRWATLILRRDSSFTPAR